MYMYVVKMEQEIFVDYVNVYCDYVFSFKVLVYVRMYMKLHCTIFTIILIKKDAQTLLFYATYVVLPS